MNGEAESARMFGAALVVNFDSVVMAVDQPIVLGAGFCSAAMIVAETTRGLCDGMPLEFRMTTKAAPSDTAGEFRKRMLVS